MPNGLRVSIPSVVLIIAITAAVVWLGGHFTAQNRDWYDGLSKPTWKPPDWVIPVVWNVLFALIIISLILVWNTHPRTPRTYLTIGAFAINGVLNVGWSFLFFGGKLILPAAIEAGLLFLSIAAIIYLAWPVSKVGALLLVPYLLWVGFATVLTSAIYQLNR